MEILLNPVLLSVVLLLIFAALRLNVFFSLVLSALLGGMIAGLGFSGTGTAFQSGICNGAGIAMNYAMLGAFSIAISRSGITELLADKLFALLGRQVTARQVFFFKYALIALLTFAAVSSQNLIPVHIAFIPILIPPLLPVFEKLRLDRRMVACILTFGLITPYMVLPVGFGKIYLNEVLLGNICRSGMELSPSQAPGAMLIPALGMVAGLLIAVFFSYRKARDYDEKMTAEAMHEMEPARIRPWAVCVAAVAIAVALAMQLFSDSLVIAALLGILVFVISGVIKMNDTQDIFTRGVHLMGGIGLVMIAASGFAEVMRASGGVEELVKAVSAVAGEYRGVMIFLMLLVGLIITMGIGSSFSTVPLIAAIYVPLCMAMGLSAAATIAVIGTAGALGDAGSPVSESVLGPTAGLNADGQHDHIYDSTIPTFLHYNLPLLAAGWIAGMVL